MEKEKQLGIALELLVKLNTQGEGKENLGIFRDLGSGSGNGQEFLALGFAASHSPRGKTAASKA